jgi:hypothetical protein
VKVFYIVNLDNIDINYSSIDFESLFGSMKIYFLFDVKKISSSLLKVVLLECWVCWEEDAKSW